VDEYLRTKALAESNSKKGIIEPVLLQMRMKTTSFLLTESLNKNPLFGWAYLGIAMVRGLWYGIKLFTWVVLLLETATYFWAFVLRELEAGATCPLPWTLQDVFPALWAALSVLYWLSAFFPVADEPMTLTSYLVVPSLPSKPNILAAHAEHIRMRCNPRLFCDLTVTHCSSGWWTPLLSGHEQGVF